MSDLSIQNSNLQSQKTCGYAHNENLNNEMSEVNIWNGQMRMPGSVISEAIGHKIVDNLCNPKPYGPAVEFGEKVAELILKEGEFKGTVKEWHDKTADSGRIERDPSINEKELHMVYAPTEKDTSMTTAKLLTPEEKTEKLMKNGVELSDGSILIENHGTKFTGSKEIKESEIEGYYEVTTQSYVGGKKNPATTHLVSEEELLNNEFYTKGTAKDIGNGQYLVTINGEKDENGNPITTVMSKEELGNFI